MLLVDDERGIRDSLSTLLQSEGYVTETAASASEAMEKIKTRIFDVLLIDIKLPDMDGTRLLSYSHENTPETIKIIISGFPSIESTVEALNVGADLYFAKPIDPGSLLEAIRRKLQERERKEKITSKRLADWVKLHVRRSQSSDFKEFMENTAREFAVFGITRTQAKIYIALNALGMASVSETAYLSGIRREEIYRIMPELERLGLATRRLGTPRMFQAIGPKPVLENLLKIKLEAMKAETSNLRQKKRGLTARMKTASTMKIEEKEQSIEVFFPQRQSFSAKLIQMIKKAKLQIKLASSLDELGMTLLKNINAVSTSRDQLKALVMTEEFWINKAHSSKPLLRKIASEQIDLRYLGELPFNLLMVDEKEAVWGEFQRVRSSNAPAGTFLTNDQTQIGLLGMAFENLWRQSRKLHSSLT